MRVKSIYICEYCGLEFDNLPDCRKHEDECNKYNSCTHAYYVYGCEFACKYYDNKQCGVNKNFIKYKEKSNE